jgi:plastocyanin domain-containing protein
MTAGAALVVVLGMVMFSNGWNLSGLAIPGLPASSPSGNVASMENNLQIVNTTLLSGRYQPITVQAGAPVRWTIEVEPESINGCNNRMIIPEYGIEHSFSPGDNVIEFTPTRTGTFRYSCWMGMIRSTITVLEPAAL